MLSRRATVRSHVVTAEPASQPFLGFLPLPREVPRGNAQNPRKRALPLFPARRRHSSPTSSTAPTLLPHFLHRADALPRVSALSPRSSPRKRTQPAERALPPLPARHRRSSPTPSHRAATLPRVSALSPRSSPRKRTHPAERILPPLPARHRHSSPTSGHRPQTAHPHHNRLHRAARSERT